MYDLRPAARPAHYEKLNQEISVLQKLEGSFSSGQHAYLSQSALLREWFSIDQTKCEVYGVSLENMHI
jgi:hypothetical protein